MNKPTEALIARCDDLQNMKYADMVQLVRDCRAALSAAPQPVVGQEPVAWMYAHGDEEHTYISPVRDNRVYGLAEGWIETPLYATPPAQPVQVQACRPEDRAMLQTPAGREMLSKVHAALASSNQTNAQNKPDVLPHPDRPTTDELRFAIVVAGRMAEAWGDQERAAEEGWMGDYDDLHAALRTLVAAAKVLIVALPANDACRDALELLVKLKRKSAGGWSYPWAPLWETAEEALAQPINAPASTAGLGWLPGIVTAPARDVGVGQGGQGHPNQPSAGKQEGGVADAKCKHGYATNVLCRDCDLEMQETPPVTESRAGSAQHEADCRRAAELLRECICVATMNLAPEMRAIAARLEAHQEVPREADGRMLETGVSVYKAHDKKYPDNVHAVIAELWTAMHDSWTARRRG